MTIKIETYKNSYENRIKEMKDVIVKWLDESIQPDLKAVFEHFHPFAHAYFAEVYRLATLLQPKSHIVETGDTLSGIALKYNTTVEAILSANPDPERKDSTIVLGDTLLIPAITDIDNSLAHYLSRGLERLQNEWLTIAQVYMQRKVGAFETQLQAADQRLAAYLSYFNGYKSGIKPLAYFEKQFSITRQLFSPVPLISLPLQLLNSHSEKDNWQALAHELGHYIYWNSTGMFQFREVHDNLRNLILKKLVEAEKTSAKGEAKAKIEDLTLAQFRRVSNLVEIWQSWLEEVVADICGTLLAGPSYVDSALQILQELEPTPRVLLHDDHDHPMPFIRPRIALAVLEWQKKKIKDEKSLTALSNLIKKYNGEWLKLESTWNTVKDPATFSIAKEIEASMNLVVDTILGDGQYKTWVDAAGKPADFGSLFEMDWWVKNLVDKPLQGIQSKPDTANFRRASEDEFLFKQFLDKVIKQRDDLFKDRQNTVTAAKTTGEKPDAISIEKFKNKLLLEQILSAHLSEQDYYSSYIYVPVKYAWYHATYGYLYQYSTSGSTSYVLPVNVNGVTYYIF